MSKERCIAQGLTNSPAITSIDTAGRCLFASCAQVCAPTKIVTPKLAGHVSIGDLKVKEKGEIGGKGDTGAIKKVMFGLTPSALLSRTFLVTPHLPGSWSAKGLSPEAGKAFRGGICKAVYGNGRRNLPPLPFGPGAGLVTPLLGGNFPGSSPVKGIKAGIGSLTVSDSAQRLGEMGGITPMRARLARMSRQSSATRT